MKASLPAICLLVAGALASPAWARIHYAQLALGGSDTGLSYECILMISNKSLTSPWEGVITLRTGHDQEWEGEWAVNGEDFSDRNGFPVSLEPAGSAVFALTGDATVRTGYLEIDGVPSFFFGDVATSFFYQLKQSGELIDSVGSGIDEAGLYFAFPIQQSSRIRTGFAWVASAHIVPLKPEEIRVGVFDADGAVFEIKTLPYEGHQARFVDELFPDLPEDFQGTMMVNSEKFIHLTVLRQDTLSSGAVQFTSTPANRSCFKGKCDLDEVDPEE